MTPFRSTPVRPFPTEHPETVFRPRTIAARRRGLPLAAAAAFAVAAFVLSGCSAPAEEEPAAAAPQETAAYPVTVDNCGTPVTLDAPPERVVTIKSTSTEMLLALGLGDRIVGTAFSDGPVPERSEERRVGKECPV